MVDRHHGATRPRDVVVADDREPQPLRPEDGQGETDDGTIDTLHGRQG